VNAYFNAVDKANAYIKQAEAQLSGSATTTTTSAPSS
jgi:hypothetical protein